MRIFRHFTGLPAEVRGSAVAIGNFDGVHKGHQALIREAGRAARALRAPWVVLTFEPHPRTVFSPELEPFRLTPLRVKAREIAAVGVDDLIVVHFDLGFSEMTADAFIDGVLVEALGVRQVVCGYNFVFGHGRKGDCELLLRRSVPRGFGFTSVPAATDDDGEIYSATRARSCLKNGDPRGAAHVLGRHFEIDGRVEEGEHRGQRIGFPTANIGLDEYLQPATGVYAVRAGLEERHGALWYNGVANLGRRPTFGERELVLEVYLFDFAGDLYGKHMRVLFVDYLRAERKFEGLEELKAQIASDSDRARRILAEA